MNVHQYSDQIELSSYCVLSGSVIDTAGHAVPGALVQLQAVNSDFRLHAVCDARGRYRFFSIHGCGPYTVSANVEGGRPEAIGTVKLSHNVNCIFNIQLPADSQC